MSPFETFVICHMIADYPLQNNWMALHKGHKAYFNFKFASLATHSIIYGIVFGIGFWNWKVGVATIFLHGIFDYLPVTNMWLKFIKSRSIDSALAFPDHQVTPAAIYAGFTAVVYCSVDFVIHWATTYPVIIYITNGGF